MADEFSATGSLHVNVVTPNGPITEGATDAVTAPGELGEFEVMPGHIPFLTALHPGVLMIGQMRKQVFAVGRGYLRVSQQGQVEILVGQAVAGSQVDARAAEAALEQATAELAAYKDQAQDGEWRNVKDRHDWASAMVEAHRRSGAVS